MKTYAIVGLGFIYPRHLQAIERSGGVVKWLCDIKEDVLFEVNNVAQFTLDYKNIVDVDRVIICTPNDLHIPIAKHFIEKGIEVLTEKPPTIDPEEITDDLKDVNVTLQLRTHPAIMKLKEVLDLNKSHTVKITTKMFRNETYWNGWKGDEKRSGGILFNLGVHYLDLILYLFGEDITVLEHSYKPKIATGKMKVGNSIIDYHFEILDDTEGQTRLLEIDGNSIELSNKDNLSYEDLHKNIYDLWDKGQAVKLPECKRVLELIKELK